MPPKGAKRARAAEPDRKDIATPEEAHRFKEFQTDIEEDDAAEDSSIPIYGSRETSRETPKSEYESCLTLQKGSQG